MKWYFLDQRYLKLVLLRPELWKVYAFIVLWCAKLKEPEILSLCSVSGSLSKLEMGVTSPDFWLFSARCYKHIRVVLWNGTDELSFWRSNSFLLNSCVDVSLWGEFIYEILTLSPQLLSLSVSCWPAFYSFFLVWCRTP